MNYRKSKKILAFLLISIIFFQVPAGVSKADTITELQKSIKEKQNAISNAQKEKQALQSGMTDVKKVISSLETSKKNLAAYISELDESLTKAQDKIQELKGQITEKEEEIEITKQELEQAIQTEETQYAAMKARIKFLYEQGDNYYVELLLSSNNFSDMLNKADYIENLSAYDRRMLNMFRQMREYVEVCKEQLEVEQAFLEEAKADVEAQEKALEELISEKEKEINKYQADINEKNDAVKEYEALIKQQNDEIKALEDAVKADQEALAEATRRRYDGGVFAWPAPSYTRISDDYGNRIHPILKVPQFHSGIDMAAPGGSPILAAYDGKVISASYSSSMGNYIMIDHGDNLYTVYMHASKLYVKRGDEVVRGQKIAAVGSTGRSTGNHLHFSVRLNGNYVNPWDYLGK